jgi:hypothetical protein
LSVRIACYPDCAARHAGAASGPAVRKIIKFVSGVFCFSLCAAAPNAVFQTQKKGPAASLPPAPL